MRMRMAALVVVVMGCCAMGARAQMGEDRPLAPLGQMVEPAKAMDEIVTMFEQQVMGVAKAMPAEKYGFAPTSGAMAGAKFDGVRTFAGQVTHLASANYYFASTISGVKPDVDMKAIGKMTSKDDCVKALADSFAFAHRAVATITPANAFRSISGADGLHTRVEVAALIAAHGFDHYGQMVEYLRMNGVLPPGSK